MTPRNVFAHFVGIVAILAGGAWLYVDVRPDGHVERATSIGTAILLSAGWFLIDKQSLSDFATWLFAQAKAAVAIVKGGTP